MSGWYYLLHGEGEDFQRGPVPIEEIRRLVANGTVNNLTKLRHEGYTRGEWMDRDKVLGTLPATMPPPTPYTAEVIPSNASKGLSTGQSVMVGLAIGMLIAIWLVVDGVYNKPKKNIAVVNETTKSADPGKNHVPKKADKKKEPITIYVTTEDLICATDPDFLDSSALVAPARFMKVPKGTELVMVHIGGMFSGNMYYGFSAGGRDRIYVYRNRFHASFKESRTIEQ